MKCHHFNLLRHYYIAKYINLPLQMIISRDFMKKENNTKVKDILFCFFSFSFIMKIMLIFI